MAGCRRFAEWWFSVAGGDDSVIKVRIYDL
jgi:hypothetical protein